MDEHCWHEERIKTSMSFGTHPGNMQAKPRHDAVGAAPSAYAQLTTRFASTVGMFASAMPSDAELVQLPEFDALLASVRAERWPFHVERYVELLLIARGAFKAMVIGAWLRRFNAEMEVIVPELERVRSRLMGFDEAWRQSTAWSDSLRLAFNRSKG